MVLYVLIIDLIFKLFRFPPWRSLCNYVENTLQFINSKIYIGITLRYNLW